MAQTISIDTKTVARILSELDKLRKDMTAIKGKLFDKEPIYGSDSWWEEQEHKATKAIKNGKYQVFDKAEDLVNDLHKSLK